MGKENIPIPKLIQNINRTTSDPNCVVNHCSDGEHCQATTEVASVLDSAQRKGKLDKLKPREVYKKVNFVSDCPNQEYVGSAINTAISMAKERKSSQS